MKNKRILFIEICNYDNLPVGGYLTFAKQMITAFGSQLYLVGSSIDSDDPVGVWFKKEIGGVTFNYFSVRKKATNKRTILPQRLLNYIYVRYFKKEILSTGIQNIFLQTPEVILALNLPKSYNVCVRIPGLRNPLIISRYFYSRLFATYFDRITFRFLSRCNVILATGDNKEIKEYIKRSKHRIQIDKIKKFPSRIDTSIFKKVDRVSAINQLGLDSGFNYIVVSGRLSQLKGWEFIINSFTVLQQSVKSLRLVFVGDGEERVIIKDFVKKKEMENDVLLVGSKDQKDLSLYLSAAVLYVSGSYVEGWSTSLMEAVACRLPCVVTNFSSAEELIEDGVNGFVVKERNKNIFALKMKKAIDLNEKDLISKSEEVKKYSTSNLKGEILRLWKLK